MNSIIPSKRSEPVALPGTFNMIIRYVKIVIIMLAVCTVASVSQAMTKMVLFHPKLPGSLSDQSAQFFAAQASNRLGHRFSIELLPLPQAELERNALEYIMGGGFHMVLCASVLPRIAPEFQIFNLPFLIRDREHMRQMEREIVQRYLDEPAMKNGLKILGVWEDGFRQIVNSRNPVENLSDLKGMRLRTPMNEWRLKTFQYLGANPTPIPNSEVYAALQKGVISGMEVSLVQAERFRIYETQRFLSITNHVYIPTYLLMSRPSFMRLDGTTQQTLIDVARRTRDFAYETAERMDREALENLRRHGMKVVTHVDTDSFRYGSKKIYDEFARHVKSGAAMISVALRQR